MLRINSILKIFTQENTIFSFPPSRKREQVLLDFREAIQGKLPFGMMTEWNELIRSNTYDSKWVLYHIISVLDEIPEGSSQLILENLLGLSLPLAEFTLKELQRILHWYDVENQIQLIFEHSKTSATRLAAVELMYHNHTTGFQVSNSAFICYDGLPNHYWHENRFLSAHPGIKDASILEATKKALHKRYSLIIRSILNDQVGSEKYYYKVLNMLLPTSEENCFEDLWKGYLAAKAKIKGM